jgi:hypothetical protein
VTAFLCAEIALYLILFLGGQTSMSYQVINPFIQFVDPTNGNPLSAGSVYFGRTDSDPKNQPTNRINVYAVQDNGSEVLLSQPITLNGAGQPQFNGSVKQLKVEIFSGESSYALQLYSKGAALKGYTPRVPALIDSASLAAVNSTVLIGGQEAEQIAKQATAQQLTLIGGALRRTPFSGSNVWEWVTDAAHAPAGVSATVNDLDAYTFRINYDTGGKWTNTKVGSIAMVTDYELAPYGIVTGANGGINSSTYQMYAPCRLFIESISSVSSSPMWTSSGIGISNPSAGVLVVTHAPRALNTDAPVLSRVAPAAGSQHNAVYDVVWGATSTTITAYDYIGGLIQYDGAAMAVSLSKNANLTASVSGGIVTVTHDDATGDWIPQITPFGSSAYYPYVVSVTATTVQIGFKDAAGAIVTSPNAAMSFYITRNSLVRSAIDAGVRMCLDLSLCRVKNADVGNISLNNFWAVGFSNSTF